MSVPQTQHPAIRVYPNPTKQEVTIDGPFNITPHDVWITDELGRPVTVKCTAVAHGMVRMDLPSSGVYSIRIAGLEQFPVRVVALK